MRCPSLIELPTPTIDKFGWPWTEEALKMPAAMPNGQSWPRITIVTPSYNQDQFLEETIRSVLLQGYPDLEYIIVDGGSSDHSVKIIKKYEPWITYWVSEPDRGQSHAINKGLSMATGEFMAYQNSDDIYWPNALKTIGEILGNGSTDVVFATADIIDPQSHRRPPICPIPDPRLDILIRFWNGPPHIFPSQGFFCRLDLLRSMGLYDENYHYKMDFDVICRILESTAQERIARIDEVVAGYRIYEGTKTGLISSRKSVEEGFDISRRYWNRLSKETRGEIAKEARQGVGFLAMCRASDASRQKRYRTALKELSLAWRTSPRLLVTRWNAHILRSLLDSFFVFGHQSK